MTTVYSDYARQRLIEEVENDYTDEKMRQKVAIWAMTRDLYYTDYETQRDNLVFVIYDSIVTFTIIPNCKDDRKAVRELVQSYLERGTGAELIIFTDNVRRRTTTKFTPELGRKDMELLCSKRNAILRSIEESDRVKEDWDEAVNWARENGAKIRRSSRGYNKHTVRVRVAEAGLTEQWNERYPSRAFTPEDLKKSKEYLRGREETYANLKNHGRKRK